MKKTAFTGNGSWHEYKILHVPTKGYVYHVFPAGYSAHWVRIVAHTRCKATAYFMYN